MIEVIDNNGIKRNAEILITIKHKNKTYVLYQIKRNNESINIFGSLITKNSEGILTIDEDFDKEELETISKRIFNKENIQSLQKDDINIINNINIKDGINKFNIDKSYITTISNNELDVFKMYYQLKKEPNKKIISIKESNKRIKKETITNIIIILFGLLAIIFCISFLILTFI